MQIDKHFIMHASYSGENSYTGCFALNLKCDFDQFKI